MSRLFKRQSSSSIDIESADQNNDNHNDRPIRQLWLRSDSKKKTSEPNKAQEIDLPIVGTLNTSTQPSTGVLNLSPIVSSTSSTREQEDEEDNPLLNQLQVRRTSPEHSSSDLSPNFYPNFVPQRQPSVLTYLQNFGRNENSANQSSINNNQQNRPTIPQEDSHRSPFSFLSRIFGGNSRTPAPQTNQIGGEPSPVLNTNQTASTLDQLAPSDDSIAPANNFPNGVIIVRTVHPGPNGTMIVNMRILPLGGLFNQSENASDNSDSGNSGLFGSLLGLLAGVQGVRMFSFGDLAGFFDEERGLDQKIIESLPTVIYDEDAFKHVDPESKKCTICLDQYENGSEIKYLWCLHRFHKGCVDRWLDKHTTCPVCKKDYSESQEIPE